MHDKVSEHGELFLLVTQVGYIVKKTENFFTLSIKRLSLGKPSLSAFCRRYAQDDNGHRFFGNDGSYMLFNCGIELANTLINPQLLLHAQRSLALVKVTSMPG
jgi:hypothetical protein